MLQSSERETEILLGNKQLLAVFFVGVALLGIAFTGGYMVGRGSTAKKVAVSPVSATSDSPAPATDATTNPQVGETHSVSAEDGAAVKTVEKRQPPPGNLLGARKLRPAASAAVEPKTVRSDEFAPQAGQEFLQVAAVPHDHAMAVAAVLRKKGFHAHAVAKPGETALYRVIVGPIRDAGELSSTRDSLRKTGFSQIVVQHY